MKAEESFRGLLAQVREVCLGAYAHQDVPFEKLVEELQPERDLSRSPLYQVMFVLQNTPPEVLELSGLTLKSVNSISEAAKFDLVLTLVEDGEELGGTLEYNTDLFEASTARRMLEHFGNLVQSIVEGPQRRLAELEIMSDAERRTVLEGWNRTRADFPRHSTIHRLFSRRAALSPDAPALSFHDASLTYAQLDSRSSLLARHLRRLGVRPDTLVALCMERSARLVVSILGVLKAGGAYLPLDPSYPLERLSLMLEDSQPPVLLTQEGLSERLPAHWGQTIFVDADWEGMRSLDEAAGEDEAARAVSSGGGASADGLAYVIYTSGSTGRPKGVMVTHRNVLRLVCGTDYVRLGPSDVVAQASNASFDAATFELWGALLSGARLHGVATDALLTPGGLERAAREAGLTTLFVTTALFNQLVREGGGALMGLRHLLFGGQAVDPRPVRRLLEAGFGGRLLHVYGPTEATTFATWQQVTLAGTRGATVPIGLPIANTTAHVLDARMRPVPAGAAGELYLGGEGLARGYLNAAGLTAERFVPDPFSPEGGARLYRTGDVVRRRAGRGEVEFVGRRDEQVKVRGFRVELGEVEAALRARAGVAECAVVAGEWGGDGDRRLVAYVVADTGARAHGAGPGVSASALREELSRSLPDYMVPSAFVFMDELPLTPNGKVDRRALPEPDPARPELERAYVAPRNGT
ncbi:MAG TPA: amino acid adenylation domain-containing protein, partial [Rubricoccaceae bacterium]|nr:amino acid adenylation domain-containing protein [Rubricoccaceae bacterium]